MAIASWFGATAPTLGQESDLERRVRELERVAHPPIDLTPAVLRILREYGLQERSPYALRVDQWQAVGRIVQGLGAALRSISIPIVGWLFAT